MSDQSNNNSNQADQPRLRLVGSEACDQHDAPQPTTAKPAVDAAQLTHELSNLLDGSLRNVSLALQKINEMSQQSSFSDPQTTVQLQAANDAMQQMALMLKQWVHGNNCTEMAGLFDQHQTLGQIIEHAEKLMRPVATEQEIQITVELPPTLSNLRAGPMQPVIMNGLRNAIEAIGNGGIINLAIWSDDDDTITLTIADDGPGIDEALPRDCDGLVLPGVTTKAQGKGLGLAISRDIVRAIGGTIRLENRPSKGAIMIVRWQNNQSGATLT